MLEKLYCGFFIQLGLILEVQLGSFLLEVRYTSTRIFKYYTKNLCRFERDGPHKQHSFMGVSSSIARDFLFSCTDGLC